MKTNLLQKNIPKGWEIKKIKDLLDFEQPTKYIVESSSYTPDGKTPVLTANKSFVLGYTNETDGVYTNTPAIIFDDFTTDSKYVDFPFKIKSSAIKILTNRDENTDLKFVYEIMKSFTFPIANHKRHYISQYQELDIIVPSTREQKKIAEILSSVDDEIQKVEEIISATEKLKHGLMQGLLPPVKSKHIPKGWEQIKLGDIADITNGKTNTQDAVSDGVYPLFDRSILIKKSNKFLFDDEVIILPGEGAEFVPKYYKGKFDLHQRTYAIFAYKDKVYTPFLYQYLFANRDIFRKTAVGSTVKSLRLPIIEKVLINLPSSIEQKKIADILSSVDEKNIINQKLKTKLLELKKGLMSDLLSGRVRVINN